MMKHQRKVSPKPNAVCVREEWLTLPTYEPAAPDKNPMFLERRVYQGSSGNVYPLPFTDRIAEQPTPRKWKAVWIENKFLRVLVLPEIGGRIHAIQDKTNGYDLIYRQEVIKPALVGLAGPWVSGGIEFNWPQHHRPVTFMPVDTETEHSADGSATVWCSDHDPIRLWERSARLDPTYSVVWRNLGIGYFNIRHNTGMAHAAYDKAFRVNPTDARLLFERDQLWKRLGEKPARRLREMAKRLDLVRQRDDLTVELCALYNQTGRHTDALALVSSRRFQPWEGGEALWRPSRLRAEPPNDASED